MQIQLQVTQLITQKRKAVPAVPKVFLSHHAFRLKLMQQSDWQRLLRNNLHLQEEETAIGRSEQLLSHTISEVPPPPNTGFHLAWTKQRHLRQASDSTAAWNRPGSEEGRVCSTPLFCLPLWAPQCHDGPERPPQHKQMDNYLR